MKALKLLYIRLPPNNRNFLWVASRFFCCLPRNAINSWPCDLDIDHINVIPGKTKKKTHTKLYHSEGKSQLKLSLIYVPPIHLNVSLYLNKHTTDRTQTRNSFPPRAKYDAFSFYAVVWECRSFFISCYANNHVNCHKHACLR